MSYYLSPIGNEQHFDNTGAPANGYKLFVYVAGSSTLATTYTNSTGSTPNANPIVMDSSGYPASGATRVGIWLNSGVSYKFIYTVPGETDFPSTSIWTQDVISGVNDTSVSQSEWIAGPTPTFIGTTSFSLVGDQTSTFHVGRRLKTTNSGGTIYSRISATAFTTLTTVTVVNDSGVLDSGLSAVSYGLISAVNSSDPSYPAGSALVHIAGTETITGDKSFSGNNSHSGTEDYTGTVKMNSVVGKDGQVPTVAAGAATMGWWAPRGHLGGLTTSYSNTTTFAVSAGECSDSTGTVVMKLTSAFTKTTGAFVAGTGNGSLDTGSVANSTWYHIFIIRKDSDGSIDIATSTTATGPTVTGYTYFRRIWSILTNGSAQITSFIQVGDVLTWAVPSTAVSSTGDQVVACPLGVRVNGLFSCYVYRSDGADASVTIRPSDGTTAVTVVEVPATSTRYIYGVIPCLTNTLSQITIGITGTPSLYGVQTIGYTDYRGRFS